MRAPLLAFGVIANHVNDPPDPRRCDDDFDSLSAALGCAIGASIVSEVEEAADQIGAVVAGMLVGGAIGAIAGRTIGGLLESEGWRPVRRSNFTVTPTSRGQVRFGVELAH